MTWKKGGEETEEWKKEKFKSVVYIICRKIIIGKKIDPGSVFISGLQQLEFKVNVEDFRKISVGMRWNVGAGR